MTLKTIFLPHLNRHVKLGRRPPRVRQPRLRLEKYIGTLPTPPSSCDYTPKARASLKDIYQNDVLGDCVIAAVWHARGVWTGNATGSPIVATPAQITGDYSRFGGYVPGDSSTDNGCDEQQVLNGLVTQGYNDGKKIAGWLAVDATNPFLVKAAHYLFETDLLGMGLPDAWVTQDAIPQADGFTWDVAGDANPDNGHAIIGAGYDSTGLIVDTWGLLGHLTWAALAKYAVAASSGEIYLLLDDEMIAKGMQRAPNGFLWADLVADFNALGGNLPVPQPAPSPAPTPQPGPLPPPSPFSVTLAQAQAAAAKGAEEALASLWQSR